MKDTHHELIDQYLSGRLSSEEMSDFEELLSNNPQVNEDFQFQSEIVEGIKDFRKAELKARLDAINVSPGWFEFARQSALVKSFSGVAVATVIGTGIFLLADKKEVLPENKNFLPVDAPFDKESLTWEIVPAPIPEEIVETANVDSAPRPQIKSSETAFEKPAIENTPDFSPQFSAPVAEDVDDEVKFNSSELDKLEGTKTGENKSHKILDVKTVNSRSGKIRYKYYDGKLFLNGDFKKEPYEILEINSANGRQIYLLYQDKFYEISITDRLTELPVVEDEALIRKLKLIRNNK